MNRQELLEALLVERWSAPVRQDRPLPLPALPTVVKDHATKAEIAVLVEELYPLRIVDTCAYAACDEAAEQQVDGWAFCRTHARLHGEEVAS